MSIVRDVQRSLLYCLAEKRDRTTPTEVLVLKTREHISPLVEAEELRLDAQIGFVPVFSRRASNGYLWAVSCEDIHFPTMNACPEPTIPRRKGRDGDEMKGRIVQQILSGMIVLHANLCREGLGHRQF